MKVIVFLYVFMFACLFTAHATTPVLKPKAQPPVVAHHVQTQPKDCIKHPQIVKTTATAQRTTDKSKVAVNDKVVKVIPIQRPTNIVPHFSVLNFINFFYTKDTLDNLHVM